MFAAVKISVGGSLDGATELDDSSSIQPGPDGIIEIDVKDVGLIDPELMGGSTRAPWLIHGIHAVLGAAGVAGDAIELVDADANLAETLLDLDGTSNAFTNSRTVIPPGYKIRAKATGTGHVVRFVVWRLNKTEEIVALPA